MKITSIEVYDVRFPTSKTLAGSDAVHKDPDYSCAYIIINTDSEDKELKGHGLTFSLGRGNEVICKAIQAFSEVLVGKDFENDILKDMMNKEDHKGFYYQITQDGQLRWLGPEKGVIHMAAGAILNAIWDLWARKEKKPLWELVVDMEPEELVEFIDFKHMTDYIDKKEALELLKKVRPGWQERKELMKTQGFRAYTTSCGWLGYSIEKVKKLCDETLKQGHTYFKMKVGSANVQEDIDRAEAIRSVIGYDNGNFLMMDANQKWDVTEAIEKMKLLSKFKPLWIEEPTNCDDILGHLTVANALKEFSDIGVATGEVANSKIIFKQLIQTNAIKYCQIDSCRIAGISEILSVLLMAAKAKIKVCPHAGGVGLCEYVRHLVMIDYVCFNPIDEIDRVCESTAVLHEYFYDPVDFNKNDSGLFYKAPIRFGYAEMKKESIEKFQFPNGEEWKK